MYNVGPRSCEGCVAGAGNETVVYFFSAVSKSTLIYMYMCVYMYIHVCNFIVLCYSSGGGCLYSIGCGGCDCGIDCD